MGADGGARTGVAVALQPLAQRRLLAAAEAARATPGCLRGRLLLLLLPRGMQRLSGLLWRPHACGPHVCSAHAGEASPAGLPEQAAGREHPKRGHRRRKRNATELATLHRRQLVRAGKVVLHYCRRCCRVVQLIPVWQGTWNQLRHR